MQTVKAGAYTIICEHEIHGVIETDFKILRTDVDLSLKYKITTPIAEFILKIQKIMNRLIRI